jgi:hypothetical protein
MATTKKKAAKPASVGQQAERAARLMQLAADPNLKAARNPQMENKIRQGIQSGLFFAALGAQYTATLEDDKAVARALAVTMTPDKWAVIADLIWGD